MHTYCRRDERNCAPSGEIANWGEVRRKFLRQAERSEIRRARLTENWLCDVEVPPSLTPPQLPRRVLTPRTGANTRAFSLLVGPAAERTIVGVSSSSSRRSPMSRGRRAGSLTKQRRSKVRIASGVAAGNTAQSGSRSRTRARRVSDGVAFERPTTAEHLKEHAAKRPDIGPLVDRRTARLLRAHVGRRPEYPPVLSAGKR